MMNFLSNIFGSYEKKQLKEAEKIADKVLELNDEFVKLTNEELINKTNEFKERLEKGETLDDILVEAFATVREASSRVLGMKHFKVQIIGGYILHKGNIAEMKTGEGKTLVATLPAYLNALTGKGVHVITVNDYLASRDEAEMGKIYNFLGLTTGCILNNMDLKDKRKAYECDITYGTNNEFGFDYLRDNMVIYKEELVQRGMNYAIIDEVDSILIDEARTPLIISGKGADSTEFYSLADDFVKTLEGRLLDKDERRPDVFDRLNKEEEEPETVDYIVDEKDKACSLTDKGIKAAEQFFNINNLADLENMEISHHINQALRANTVMKKDIDYVVEDGEVMIVDEFTGRIMKGRRYSNGLHQAIEAKEGIKVNAESKTLASITFQNLFRMYDKISGMTGTAETEKEEFMDIYDMSVVTIPTNKPIARIDYPDVVFLNEIAKNAAIINTVRDKYKKGQPVLVGTISVESSELFSKALKHFKIPHKVLNAKRHMQEAEIIAQAGKLGAVTIATNMAGRGTDIVLGGNPSFMAKKDLLKDYDSDIVDQVDSLVETKDEVLLEARRKYRDLLSKYKKETDENAKKVIEAGGLCIIGTERHESRRIDNQLRGRAGRQGDPGETQFYISLEDDLMRLFGGSRIDKLVDILKMTDIDMNMPLEHKMLSNSIEGAQKKIEGANFNTRKYVLQYDDVMNKQREVIYAERKKVLENEDLSESIMGMIESIVELAIDSFIPDGQYPEEWDTKSLYDYLFSLRLIDDGMMIKDLGLESKDKLKKDLTSLIKNKYKEKEKEVGSEHMRELERVILLRVVDSKWMDHIDAMDQLKQGIGLRAIGQNDPVIAYQNEGFLMFEEMNHVIKEETIKYLISIQTGQKIERKQMATIKSTSSNSDEGQKPVVKNKKVGRNEPCPCGSGKKYKKCCGQ